MTSSTPIDPLLFPLSGVRLIEASAGTGKTFTIAALYLRLVLGHGLERQALLPPEILVVTFTEAATQELRERIRSRLNQAAAYFRELTGAADPFLSALRQEYPPEQWPACAYRLHTAANWMDEAAVYTIHGWCRRMLQQHAFDSGGLFDWEVDNDDQDLLQQTVCDYWRRHFYSLSEPASAAVARCFANPDALSKEINPLLFDGEALELQRIEVDLEQTFACWEEWALRYEQLTTRVQTLWRNQQNGLETRLLDASEQGWLKANLYPKAGFKDKLAQIAAWANHRQNLEVKELARFSLQKLTAGLAKAHQDKAALFDSGVFALLDQLVGHQAEELDLADAIRRHAVAWIRERYAREKQRLSRLTFDDMLTRLDQALGGDGGARLANIIVRQYPLALIDEFQDTDPVQYRIFSRLYPADADNGGGCFMIGDPKQAIYSFRGGDIYTYLQAHAATQGRHYTLAINFRSTVGLVQAVNRLFEFAERGQPEGAFKFGAETHPLPFIPVSAQGRDETWMVDGRAAPAFTVWHLENDEPVGMPFYRHHMAEATASEIVHLLTNAAAGNTGFRHADGNWRALQPGDIALLVRSRSEAEVMGKALSKRRLRSVFLSERESVYASREAGDLLLWLHALATPEDEYKVRAALASRSMEWSLAALQRLAQDESAWEHHLERFLSYRERWRQDGILPALQQLMHDYRLPAKLRNATDGERRLTNLLHLAELLQHADSRLDGEAALIRHLAEALQNSGGSTDDNVIRLESDAELLKIVTIHKSKGLEYPLVFLPFICSFREVNARNNRYYRYHDTAARLRVDLSKNDANKALSDNERLQEDIRLLYVAVTRARFACWLGVAPVKGPGKQCQLEKSAMGYVLGWQSGLAAPALAARLGELAGACPDIAVLGAPPVSEAVFQANREEEECRDGPRNFSASIREAWWIASYSALAANHTPTTAAEAETAGDDKRQDESEPAASASAGPANGIHALPRGAAAGVLIHALLERAASEGFASVAAQAELQAQLIKDLFGQPDWLGSGEQMLRHLAAWLECPLAGTPTVSLNRLPPDAYQAEMEFLLGVDSVDVTRLDALLNRYCLPGRSRPALQTGHINGLLKGFIDLVFVCGGRYYVLDYKFNALGNRDDAYGGEALTTALLAKRYDLQAALYLLALHRLLKSRLHHDYHYQRDVGGSLYWFLRGVGHPGRGQLLLQLPQELIETLDAMFAGVRT